MSEPEVTPAEVLPVGAAAPVAGDNEGQGMPAAEPEDTSIEIEGQRFTNEKEAFEFARGKLGELKAQADVAEAYQAGIRDSLQHGNAPNNVTPQVPAEKDNWEERFYADPKSTLRELREDIKREVKGELAGADAEEAIWREFFTAHPDLDGFRDDVQVVLTRETKQIQALNATKGKQAAMTYLAAQTRTKFEEYMERKKPSTALTNKKAGPSTGSQTNVTPKPTEKKPLSMIEQMRTMKESRRKKY